MKPTATNEEHYARKTGTALHRVCRACSRKILAQTKKVKEMILAESSQMLRVHPGVLRLALNEAEALAWQTNYPHLFFPALATEKIQAIEAWNERQQTVRGESPALVLAA